MRSFRGATARHLRGNMCRVFSEIRSVRQTGSPRPRHGGGMPHIPCPGGGTRPASELHRDHPGLGRPLRDGRHPRRHVHDGQPRGREGPRRGRRPAAPGRDRPFWMGKTEVTWDEYDQFAFKDGRRPRDRTNRRGSSAEKDADAVTRPTPPYADETFGLRPRGPARPSASRHHAAMEYCRWLSAKTGKTYRLPTEAEWEYACRAGTKTAYSFGDDPKELGEYAWYVENADEKTQPVGKKKPNPWGLHDMHGNVAEWCLDHYAAGRLQPSSRRTSPRSAPSSCPTAGQYPHVARGGSWDDDADRLRSAARRGSEPRLEPAWTPAAAEHLVAHRRRLRRLPRRAGRRGAGGPEGAPLPGPQGGALSRSDPRAGRVPPQLRACRNVTLAAGEPNEPAGRPEPESGCRPAANFHKPAHRRNRR